MILTNEYQFIGRSNAVTSSGGYAYYLLAYAKTEPDTTAGAHSVSVKLRMACTVASDFYGWSTTGFAKVAGIAAIEWSAKNVPNVSWSKNLTEGGVYYSRWVDLKEGTALVSTGFGADKEASFEASWVLNSGSAVGWMPPAGEYAKITTTVTLPAIEGPTVPVMGAESVELGKPVRILTPALLAGCTHSLSYSIGSTSGIIAENVEDACTWTPPIDLAAQIPNSPSGTAVITCTTYRDGEQFGAPQQTTVLLIVPESVVPTASATWADTSGAFNALGVYAKGVSKLAVDVAGTGAYGSTIISASMTLGGSAYSGGIINTVGDLELVVTVKDSRGHIGSVNYTITVADYAAPSLTLDASRCTETGEADDVGEYAQVTVSGYVSPVGANAATLLLQYGSTEESVELHPGDIAYTTIIPAPSTSTIGIAARLADNLTSAPASMTLSIGYATMDFLDGGKGIAFGTTATQEGFTCAMDAKFTSAVSVPEPAEDSHAASKGYVDTAVQSIPVSAVPADYVVEVGSEGIWTWRKWHSGYIELDGKKDYWSTNYLSQSGNIYYAYLGEVAFPFELAEITTVSFGFIATTGNVWHWGQGVSTTGITNSYVGRGNSASVAGYPTFHITGKWK